MDRHRTFMSVALGLLVGAGMAGLGLWLGAAGESAAAPAAPPVPDTVTPDTPTSAAFWVAPGETVLGPTVLVATGIEAGEEELVLSYDLVNIAPPAQGLPGPNAAEAAAAPQLWTLLTSDGSAFEAETTAAARTARFDVPEGFDPAAIDTVRVDAWRVRLPVTHRLEIAHDDLGAHVLEPGTSVTLRIILAQAQNTLVQFRVDHPVDGFSGGATSFSAAFEAQPGIRGVGPGWTNVGITESGIQLTYVGGELADPFPIEVGTHEWWTVTEPLDVDMSGVVNG